MQECTLRSNNGPRFCRNSHACICVLAKVLYVLAQRYLKPIHIKNDNYKDNFYCKNISIHTNVW